MHAYTKYSADGPIAGVDEAGRGPLAGPVVAAAVILPESLHIDGLRDSKKLTAQQRERLLPQILQNCCAAAIGWSDPAEIDTLNILNATMLAMRRALIGLRIRPVLALVDGNRLPDLRFDAGEMAGEAIVGGDDKVAAISAASIIAKTARDGMMLRLHELYPGYGFASHKGYGSQSHRQQIMSEGPCHAHRYSFRPISTEWPSLSRWHGQAGSLRACP